MEQYLIPEDGFFLGSAILRDFGANSLTNRYSVALETQTLQLIYGPL